MRRRVAAFVAVAGLAGLFASAGFGSAIHLGLRSAEPAADDSLTVAPTELILTFTATVDPRLATLDLFGPAGAVELGDPEGGSTDRVLVVAIAERLRPGPYTVRWRVVGADGHPVTGDYGWVVRADAAGLAPPPTPGEDAPTAEAGPPAPGQDEREAAAHQPAADADVFDAESVGYVIIRWLTFVALLGVLGPAGYALVVLPLAARRMRTRGMDATEARGPQARGAATVGIVAAALALVLAFVRLVAQSRAVHGAGGTFDAAQVFTMVAVTLWGWAWILQVVASAAAVGGFLSARGGSRAGWAVAALAALMLAFTPSLSGHAAAVTELAPLPVLADGLHVLAAGGWLGTLLVLLVVGVRRAARRGAPDTLPLAPLVEAFSATALAFASVLVLTGVFSAWLHLPSLDALWGSAYGRVLLVKLGVLVPVFATGAYNWRRVRPALADGGGAAPLRRSGWSELAVAVLVLLVTAVLVATPTPMAVPPDAATAANSTEIGDFR